MATNEILQFAETDTGANLLTQAEYLADAQRPIGNQPGVARSKLVNKALRQSSLIASGIAEFLADNQSNNITDSLTPQDVADYMAAVVRALGIPTAVAGGTADAITADFTPNVALANGTTVIVRAGAANTTTTPTFAPDGLTAKTIVKGNNLALAAGDIAGAGHWLEMNFDSVLDKWVLQNPAYGVLQLAIKKSEVRQSVIQCPLDNSGLPSFLPTSSGTLSLTSTNITSGVGRLIVSAAGGVDENGPIDRIGVTSSNLTWGGLTANATNYLYVDVGTDGTLTPGKSTVAPVYQVLTTNPGSGADYFSIQQMAMKDNSGVQRYRVYIGEAVTNTTTVTSTVTYAALGRFQSTLQAISTVVNFNHNLGVMPRVARMVLVCVTAESNYAVGDELPIESVKVAGPNLTNPYGMVADRKTAVFMRNTGPALLNKTTATANNVNEANWNVKLYVERGW